MISDAEAKKLLVSLLPAGAEDLYDLDDKALIGGTMLALGQTIKKVLLDRVENLRLELNPSTMTEKISDWEEACGLTNTPIARFGTIDQRRNAVIAILRTSGSFSYDDIRSIVQPYFLYQDPSQIQIVETNRSSLRNAHTYSYNLPQVIPAISTSRSVVLVADDPKVSAAGAHLIVNLTGYIGDVSFILTGPDGTNQSFLFGYLPPRTVTNETFDLCAPEFVGKAVRGKWELLAYAGFTPLTINSWGVFVEGIGVNFDGSTPPKRIGEGLGASMFFFAVVANPALLGTGYDIQGARRSINRWKPAHTDGTVVVSSGIVGASSYAIPDTESATPNAAIPGP